jgi:hypothetical protein
VLWLARTVHFEQRHGGGEENEIQSHMPFDPDYKIPWNLSGTYNPDDGSKPCSISKNDGQWMISGKQGGEFVKGRIVAISETKFIADGISHYMTFEVDQHGEVAALNFEGYTPRRLVRSERRSGEK